MADQQAAHALVPNTPPADVLVVNSAEAARKVASWLMDLPHPDRLVFACDTEVSEIDVTSQSPCCHGRLICFSVHAGPSVDFTDALGGSAAAWQAAGSAGSTAEGRVNGSGNAAPAPSGTTLWVDTWLDGDPTRSAEAEAILAAFGPFFESAAHRKVWHNFSFDRHIIERAGLRHAGFEADTMHMARLWDSSRSGKLNYSLESLSSKWPRALSGCAGACPVGWDA